MPASAERFDSMRTSCATTANPRPASPARAASMAAFSASRLVCQAMLATSAAIFCRCAVTSCRLSILPSICCLLAAAPASMSSSERNSCSLAANASTMLLPLRLAFCAGGVQCLAEPGDDAGEAFDQRDDGVSIWSREASMCDVHTSATSAPNARRLAR